MDRPESGHADCSCPLDVEKPVRLRRALLAGQAKIKAARVVVVPISAKDQTEGAKPKVSHGSRRATEPVPTQTGMYFFEGLAVHLWTFQAWEWWSMGRAIPTCAAIASSAARMAVSPTPLMDSDRVNPASCKASSIAALALW